MGEAGLGKESLFQARDYQLNAAREVLEKGNSLVIMPTALGKTFVAALVAREILSKKPGAKILFLAPTKPLALQQASRLRELLGLGEGQAAVVTGEVGREERKKIYSSGQVRLISATPQTISHDAKEMNFADFLLVVFDEAHRAIGDYAYTAVAAEARKHARTILLGLTASPSAQEGKIREICEHLAVRHVVAKQETDEDVSRYVQKIELDWKPVALPEELLQLKFQLLSLAQEPYSFLKKLSFLGLSTDKPNKKQLLAARQRLLAGQSPVRFRGLSLLAKLMNLLHAIDLLESQGVSALKNYLDNLEARKQDSRAVRELASDFRVKKLAAACGEFLSLGLDHPKMDLLLDLLRHKVSEGKSAIVFAHYRDSVKNIFERLNSAGIESKMLVGKAGEGMSQKQQAEVVQQFREKEFPVLISTSIGEEGLDIPTVDLVVFYDAVPSEVRLIQRRGRTGRVRAGETVILYTKDTKDEAYHWSSRYKEKKMHELVGDLREKMISQQEDEGKEPGKTEKITGVGQKKISEF